MTLAFLPLLACLAQGCAGGGSTPPPPIISRVTPGSGRMTGGTTLTLEGERFAGTVKVSVGSGEASGVTVNAAGRRLTCRTPPAAAPGAVDLSVLSSINGRTSSSRAFTYNPLPSISRVSPSSGPIVGGTRCDIDGAMFLGDVVVTFGEISATGVTVNAAGTQVSCSTPRVATARLVDVAVESSSHGRRVGTGAYTYNPAPSIDVVSPTSGPLAGGMDVTLNGANFLGSIAIAIGTASPTAFTVDSGGTRIRFRTPAATAPGPVGISLSSNSHGSATAPMAYTYNPLPSIDAVTPSSGALGGGTVLTIDGSGFFGTVNVTLGTVPASMPTANPAGTQLTCLSPPGAGVGIVNVAVESTTHGVATPLSAFTYNPTSTITGLSPDAGPISGSTNVTITGTNLLGGLSVMIGGLVTTITGADPAGTFVKCRTPASPSTGRKDVRVISSTHGPATRTAAFRYFQPVTATFGAPSSFASGGTLPFRVATGDLDRDGRLDLAVANLSSSNVGVLLGTGTGSFGAATTFSTVGRARVVAISDLNRDGIPDLAVVTDTAVVGVGVLLGIGTGAFGSVTSFPAGAFPDELVVGDFNRDGVADVAADNESGGCSVLLGTGTGALGAPSSFPTGSQPGQIATGDLNRDGVPDLLVSNFLSGTVSVLLGTGTGSFLSASNFSAPALFSMGIADLDGDGSLDLAGSDPSSGMKVLIGTGTGALGAAANFPTTLNQPKGVAIGDVDRDGLLDLATGEGGLHEMLPGKGGGSFASALAFSGGGSPEDIVAGDFNRDGRLDLATVNRSTNVVAVTLNTTTRSTTVSFDPALSVPVTGGAAALTVLDFDRDGRADLAVGGGNAGAVTLMRGTGSGGFGSTSVVAVGLSPSSVVAADLDRDGLTDVAVTNEGSNTVSVMAGTGTGLGTPANITVGASPSAVAVGDLNGDGRADLVVANAGGDSVSVLLGSGGGGFGPPTSFAVGGVPRGVVVGDFDRNGTLDVATANAGSGNVSVLPGTGTGSLGAASAFPAGGASARALAAGDVNRDGVIDLAVAVDGSVGILLGTVSGTFGVATTFAAGTTASAVAVQDLNRDGILDVVVTAAGADEVSLLLGAGDGSLGAPAAQPVAAGPASVAVADLNGDGKLDILTSGGSGPGVSVVLQQ